MTTQPKKYVIPSGNGAVWDTDIQFNTALSNKIGDGCIEFLDTEPANNPFLEYDEFIPVEEGAPYSLFSWMRADSVGVSDEVYLLIDWYDDDQVLDSTSNAYQGVMPAANTWYRLGNIIAAPSGVRYAKPRFGKENLAFASYFDDVSFSSVPVAFHAYDGASATSIGVGLPGTLMTLDSEDYDYGANFDSTTNYRFTIPVNGVYGLGAQISCSVDAGDTLICTLRKNGTTVIAVGQDSDATTTQRKASATTPAIYLQRGDYVDVLGRVTGLGSHTCDLGAGSTFFMGARVE